MPGRWPPWRPVRLAEAEALFKTLADELPNLAEVRYNLGYLYEKRGARAEAEAEYRKALELQPQNAHALVALCALLDQQGKAAEALALLEAKRSAVRERRAACSTPWARPPSTSARTRRRSPPSRRRSRSTRRTPRRCSSSAASRWAATTCRQRSSVWRSSWPWRPPTSPNLRDGDGAAADAPQGRSRRRPRLPRRLVHDREGLDHLAGAARDARRSPSARARSRRRRGPRAGSGSGGSARRSTSAGSDCGAVRPSIGAAGPAQRVPGLDAGQPVGAARPPRTPRSCSRADPPGGEVAPHAQLRARGCRRASTSGALARIGVDRRSSPGVGTSISSITLPSFRLAASRTISLTWCAPALSSISRVNAYQTGVPGGAGRRCSYGLLVGRAGTRRPRGARPPAACRAWCVPRRASRWAAASRCPPRQPAPPGRGRGRSPAARTRSGAGGCPGTTPGASSARCRSGSFRRSARRRALPYRRRVVAAPRAHRQALAAQRAPRSCGSARPRGMSPGS